MAFSIKEISAQSAIQAARLDGDSTLLINYLRSESDIPEEIRLLCADILTGAVKAKPKIKSRARRLFECRLILCYTVNFIRSILDEFRYGTRFIDLGEGHSLEWRHVHEQLLAAGYTGDVDTKGEITKAAKCLTAGVFNISLDELDEALINRTRKNYGRN